MKKTGVSFGKRDAFILTFILVTALLFRLYRLDIPLGDLHSWRQADTAAVARNFVRHGFDLLHPRYDDLSSIESGRENPQGYRMVEFPLYNAFFAFMYRLLPIFSLEIYGRLTSAAFSLIGIVILYYLLLKESGRTAASAGALIYSVFPFFVFFSRVVLPETTAVALSLLALFFLYRAFETERTRRFFLSTTSLFFFALALLVKPTTVFFGIPLLYLFLRTYGFSAVKKMGVYAYFIISAVPLFLWRLYIQSYPEGIPASDWLITSVNTYQGLQVIFFRPAFFRWVFFERVHSIILGGYAGFFLLLGFFRKSKKNLIYAVLLGSLAYLFTFQGGNVQHEYYQVLILPAIAMLVGIGIETAIAYSNSSFHRILTYMGIPILLGASFFFSYYRIKDYYNYSIDLERVANVIQTVTKPEDKIVTDTTGDTTLLYLSDRKGAPALYKDERELKKLGYTHMVIFNKDYSNQLKQNDMKVVFENDKFTLFLL